MLIDQIKDIVYGEKAKEYGKMSDSFPKIAQVWSAILGTEVTANDVALMMIGLKIIREKNRHKDDNILDIYGYGIACEELNDK